jgi:hypothetical protein
MANLASWKTDRESGYSLGELVALSFLGCWVNVFHNFLSPWKSSAAKNKCLYTCDIAENECVLGLEGEEEIENMGSLPKQ